jgi:diguanylate cyclase (GGDEF)-like protein
VAAPASSRRRKADEADVPTPLHAPSDAAATSQALLARADWLLYLDGPRCGTLGREVLALTAASPDLPLRADAWWHVAYAALRAAEEAEAVAAIGEARAGYARHGDARGLLRCDEFDASHLRAQGRLDEALAMQLRLAARTGVARTPEDLYVHHTSRGITRNLLGQADEMLRDFYDAQAAAEACASPGPRINALVNLGGSHGDLYNLHEALALSERAMDVAEAAGAWNGFAIAAFNVLIALDGTGAGERCGAVVARLRAHESRLPPWVLSRNAPVLAMAYLAAGDLAQSREWLDRGEGLGFGESDGRTDFARVSACWLMAQGRFDEARRVAEARIAESAQGDGVQDQPYPHMRLLRAAADACERVGDAPAALRYLRQVQALYETLMARSSRAGAIALQAAHDYERAQADRDRARMAHEAAERDRHRLAQLNAALEDRMAETQRLNAALEQKMAEAEALQRQLREQAVRDPLTQLHNRRFLAETAEARIEHARRTGSPLCVVLIDIDHFKRVNDLHGHEAGDRVLVAFADLLRERLRKSDTLCRFGGEEFLLLLDPCEEPALRRLLEDLLARFRGLAFAGPAGAFHGCTFSAGIAARGPDGEDFDAMVRTADQRMYRAKTTGRARVLGLTANGSGVRHSKSA